MRRPQPQAATEPASTPSQRVASSIHPASRTTSRLSWVIACGSRRIEVSSLPSGEVNGAVPSTAAMSGFAQSCDGGLTGRRAEQAGVLPDVHRLGAEGDPVEGGLVAVLAGDRDLAGEALGLEGGDDAAGHPVVLGQDGVDLVVRCGEELLHGGLGDRGIPVVGVVLTDDRDRVAALAFGRDAGVGVSLAEEVGVGVGGVALDDDEVAFGDDVRRWPPPAARRP